METEVIRPRVALFISVGTTAIRPEVGGTRDDYKELQKNITAFKKDAGGRDAAELAALPTAELFAAVVEAHAEILRRNEKDIPGLSEYLSAEMTSTIFLARHRDSGFGGGLDPGRVRIVFLASDTAVGLFCAHVNAALLHQVLVRPACKCGAPFDDFVNGPACSAVHVRVVPGMEARRLDTIYPRIESLCKAEAEGCGRVMFNITGGYKGALPAITWLAATFYGERAELFYQHETALSATRITFVETVAEGPLGMEESTWAPQYR